MKKDESSEFTDRERYYIAFLRTTEHDSVGRYLFYDFAVIALSAVFVCLFYSRDDIAFAFVAYGLVIYRLIHSVFAGVDYSRALASIVRKYEAQLSELESAARDDREDTQASTKPVEPTG